MVYGPVDLLLWQTQITEAWLRAVHQGDNLERLNQEQALLFIEYLIEQSRPPIMPADRPAA